MVGFCRLGGICKSPLRTRGRRTSIPAKELSYWSVTSTRARYGLIAVQRPKYLQRAVDDHFWTIGTFLGHGFLLESYLISKSDIGVLGCSVCILGPLTSG